MSSQNPFYYIESKSHRFESLYENNFSKVFFLAAIILMALSLLCKYKNVKIMKYSGYAKTLTIIIREKNTELKLYNVTSLELWTVSRHLNES